MFQVKSRCLRRGSFWKGFKQETSWLSGGVISGSHSLVFQFCFGPEKSHYHLFLHCPIVADVWYCISDWMDLYMICPWVDIFEHLLCFDHVLRDRLRPKFRIIIWLVDIRAVWITRNNTLFSGGNIGIPKIVLVAKFSWKWLRVRFKGILSCLKIDWISNSINYLS